MTKPLFLEAIKIKEGLFINPCPHKERIFRTTQHFFSEPLVVQLTDDMIPVDLRTGVVKCRIVYSDEVTSMEFEPYKMRDIQSLILVEDNTIDYSFKYYNRETINRLFAQRKDCDDILIIKDSLITDTSYSNVVFKDFDGHLYTPSNPLLPGTKRQKLLNDGIIHEKVIHVNDLGLYAGVYLINAMIDIEDNLFIGSAQIR